MKLYESVAEFKEAERTLNELLYQEQIDEKVVTDTLDSLMLDIDQKCISAVQYARELESTAKQIKEEEARLKARRERLQDQADRVKGYVKQAMESVGVPKIDSPLFTLSLRKSPGKVVIEDEHLITGEWKEVIQQVKIKKSEIAKALKSGGFVEGARLESGKTLQIK